MLTFARVHTSLSKFRILCLAELVDIFFPFRMLRITTCILSLEGLPWKNFISKFSAQSWQQRTPWIGSALYIGAVDTLHLIFPKLTFCTPRVVTLKNILRAVRAESYKETGASLRSPTKRLEQNQITCSWLNFIYVLTAWALGAFSWGRLEQTSILLRSGTDKPENDSTQTQLDKIGSLLALFTK